MMERLVCVAIGYLFGLFQTAYIYGKLHGIDIRNYGSGNAGTTNTLRVLGTKAGLIVLAGDILNVSWQSQQCVCCLQAVYMRICIICLRCMRHSVQFWDTTIRFI